MPKIKWDTKKVNGKLYEVLERNVGKAAAYAASESRKSIKSQPRRIYPSGRMVGLDPSRPGEPPKQVTARLKQSLKSAVKREGKEVVGAYGTNVIYGRALELGFTGTDSRGRVHRLAARPYLRPIVSKFKRQIGKIIATGKK